MSSSEGLACASALKAMSLGCFDASHFVIEDWMVVVTVVFGVIENDDFESKIMLIGSISST